MVELSSNDQWVELDKKRGRFKVRLLRNVRGKMPAEAADYQAVAGDACYTRMS
jgi:hypothetical protein